MDHLKRNTKRQLGKIFSIMVLDGLARMWKPIRIDAGWLHCIDTDLNEDVEGNMKEAGVDEAVGKVAPQLKNLRNNLDLRNN